MYKHTYLLSLAGILAVPATVLFLNLRGEINIQNVFILVAVLGCAGIAADIWATRQNKKDKTWIWEFNSKNVVSSRILGHPLEEYIYFILFLPYIILLWELLNRVVFGGGGSRDIILGILVLLWVHIVAFIAYRYQRNKIKRRHAATRVIDKF
jgi:lycopene cyclase domain-containing protein